jgi:hypothetical protein
MSGYRKRAYPSSRWYVYDFFLQYASMILRVEVQCETIATFSSVPYLDPSAHEHELKERVRYLADGFQKASECRKFP